MAFNFWPSRKATKVNTTIVSENCTMEGDISTNDNLIIQGIVVGDVRSSAHVMLSPKGRVVGNIRARFILINGQVEGHCQGDVINIQKHGLVKGNLISNNVVLQEGSKLHGQVFRPDEKSIDPILLADNSRASDAPRKKKARKKLFGFI
ncbi:bactofilin family protein [Vibrio barjaei]|uniref:bactofilin family protein n=1 Tax=Vibrio barjaei TaxID=1676683 RepID=UPI002284F519|nr:polymer-forming cytoskeletal protein [Vibrio barjaei]MCY9872377.1 polymer-forming cytoskeletal protein [Vibrio barjaei]